MVFNTATPVELLHPHQALAFVNRWLKLKDYWFSQDKEVLYSCKDQLLLQWIRSGTMKVTAVIERASPVHIAMRAQLATGGADLELFGSSNGDLLSDSEDFEHWQVLAEFLNGTVKVPIPPDVQQREQQAYQHALQAYGVSLQQYQVEQSGYKHSLQTLQAAFKVLAPDISVVLQRLLDLALQQPREQRPKVGVLREALAWVSTDSITIKQMAQVKRQLREHGVLPDGFAHLILPSDPPPVQPLPPQTTIDVDADAYVTGSSPDVEAALLWARSKSGRADLMLSDIDDHLVWDLETKLKDEALEVLRAAALLVFQSVLDGRLATAEVIYSELTAFPLSYHAALGMRSKTNRGFHDQAHADFCQWHALNLPLTGKWLLEFESTVDSSLCFHIPYDRALKLGFAVEGLPHKTSSQSAFGRPIAPDEQLAYPIDALLQVLGLSQQSFPCQLQTPSRFCCDDDDEGFDWDDDDEVFDADIAFV